MGNAAYPEASLRNPVNDAVNLSDHLQSLGFLCQTRTDATIKDMEKALKQFRHELADADVGLFFFAGHGMQIEAENFLTAVNTDFDTEMDAKHSSLALNKVIEVLENGSNDTSILILDACRNNPYERKWRAAPSRGLAPVYAPKGTIIAFATSPGQTASDGPGTNGAFTSAILKHIDAQNLTIEDLFKRVRNTLSASTNGKQTSWEHTSLMGDFFFNTSIVTGEFIAKYSPEARADAGFDLKGGRSVLKITRALKSSDWYRQNPAIKVVTPDAIHDSSTDELFVLGRNIYQAACGESTAAVELMSELDTFLKRFEKEVSFHILNGMLYEVYFDSSDRFRERKKKTGKWDALLGLEGAPCFSLSFDFIRQALMPHEKQLFYAPGGKRRVLVDVEVVSVEGGKRSVGRILVEGQDVFYTSDGKTLVANVKSPDLHPRSLSEFEESLLEEMAVPKHRAVITYSPEVLEGASLSVPGDYRILRVGK